MALDACVVTIVPPPADCTEVDAVMSLANGSETPATMLVLLVSPKSCRAVAKKEPFTGSRALYESAAMRERRLLQST